MIARLLFPALLLMVFATSPVSPGGNPIKLLQAVNANFQMHTSLSYTAVLHFKFLSEEDTLTRSGRCCLFRDPADTLFGGLISLITTDSVERRYTGKEIYLENHRAKTVEIFKGNKEEKFGITGNIVEKLLLYSFLRKDAFSKFAAEPNVVSYLGQATVDGRACAVVSICLPDDEETTDDTRTYWIDTLANVPLRFTRTVKMGKQVEYQELLLSDVVLDGVKRSDLAEFVIPPGYTASHFQPPDYTLLSDGTRAPSFAGRKYPSDEETQIADYAGKVILLDFWYMSCGPCQKSIPGLTALQEKYAGRGLVVVGVNWPDADSTGRRKLGEFVKERGLRCTILLAASPVADAYKVKAYPTLYLIDRQGTIRYSQLGFNTDIDDTLVAVIERELDRDH